MKKFICLSFIFAVMTAAFSFAQDGTADIDKQIAEYSEAIKNNPNDVEAYLRRGRAYIAKGDYDKAIADYSEMIRLKPAHGGYRLRGNVYAEKGDYDKAIADFSEVIKQDSADLNAYLNRSIAYYHTKNYDAAIADCTTVIKGAPNAPAAYVTRGDAYGAKGIYHKAAADYRTSLEKGFDPSGFTVDKSSKADMWFCGALYMEITVNRFVGKPDAVSKYENWLKTVCDKNKLTRADVEAYFRQNIGSLVAETVDEEFNKVVFRIDRHNATLTRNAQTREYTLNYGGVNTNDETRTITTNSPEALSSEMRNGKNKADFTSADLDTVRSQAALIPAVVYDRWQRELGIINGLDTLKGALTNFYLDPAPANYNILLGIYAKNRAIELGNQGNTLFQRTVINSLVTALSSLNTGLAVKVTGDMQKVNIRNTAAALTGAKYQAFSTPFSSRE